MIKRIEEYFLYFITYSVIGWIYEVFLETVIYGWGFSNRGVLFGPYCPVYGVGALIFILTVNKLIAKRDKACRLKLIPVVFLLCMLIATFVELLTTYILEYFTGGWPWQTYGDYAINFQARIALNPSVRFGIGGVIILYIIQPVLEKSVMNFKYRKYGAVSIAAIFAADIIYTFFVK